MLWLCSHCCLKDSCLEVLGSAHFNIKVSLGHTVLLSTTVFLHTHDGGLRVICHRWDKCPLVSSQNNLCCAPPGGKAGIWLVRELNLHSRSISWCRRCALRGSPSRCEGMARLPVWAAVLWSTLPVCCRLFSTPYLSTDDGAEQCSSVWWLAVDVSWVQ